MNEQFKANFIAIIYYSWIVEFAGTKNKIIVLEQQEYTKFKLNQNDKKNNAK